MVSESRSTQLAEQERVEFSSTDPWAHAFSLGVPDAAFVCAAKEEWVFGFGAQKETSLLAEARAWAQSGHWVLGGRAFDAETPLSGPWEGWPTERWFVPELCLRFKKGKGEAFGNAEAVSKMSSRLLREWKRAFVPRQLAESKISKRETLAWQNLHRAALENIRQGAFSKVVIARSVSFSHEALAPDWALQNASLRFPSCTAFLLKGPNGVFLGATPETLAAVHGNMLSTEAVAGSAAPGHEDWLLKSEKERREHQAVVEGVLSAVAPFAKSVRPGPQPEVLRLSNVLHLRTRIEVELRDPNEAHRAVLALHPTPAVNGLPKEPASEFLREHESLSRGFYAGVVGHLFGDEMDLKVALRSALIRPEQTLLFVGAGVVEGSDAASEWAETERKAQAMREVLGGTDSDQASTNWRAHG